MLLDQIKKENDIHNIPMCSLQEVADDARKTIIETVSSCGGHLASNLGVVELTIALHYVLSFPKDKLIWDVGHQSYTHKLLTGRQEEFKSLRKFGGLSGFPKRAESDADCFETGHSSTSISAGLGFVRAREIKHDNYKVVSVIGDGSLTGGLAYEALNNLTSLKSNFIIILNDNEFSISANIGGVSKMLNSVRTADPYLNLKDRVEDALGKLTNGNRMIEKIKHIKGNIKQLLIPGKLFENMGITYLGPVDGHNIPELIRVLKRAEKLDHGVIVHVQTQKGKGYRPAELYPNCFHGVGKFDITTGDIVKSKSPSYTSIFSDAMLRLGCEHLEVTAVSAAMSDGTGLSRFQKLYPDRFFDVGIAEQHAVTFSAGLCAAGLKPVVAIYSTFLQRAFDEIIHDVCMQRLPVVFILDRAGLVGADGQTHHGNFDYSYLSLMPNITIMAPKNAWELEKMLDFSISYDEGPVAIRFPRGEVFMGLKEFCAPIEYGKFEEIYNESGIIIFANGSMVKTACEVRDILSKQNIECSIVNARFIKPLDEEMLIKKSKNHRFYVTIEDNSIKGGFGEQVLEAVNRLNLEVSVLNFAIPDKFIEQGTVSELRESLGLNPKSISDSIVKFVNRNREN